jgi:hypothetical protein
MSSQTVSKYEVPLWRVWVVYALLITVVAVITFRLLTRQVLEYKTWQDQAVELYTGISDRRRVAYYDRNGFVLAILRLNAVIPAGCDDGRRLLIYRSSNDRWPAARH